MAALTPSMLPHARVPGAPLTAARKLNTGCTGPMHSSQLTRSRSAALRREHRAWGQGAVRGARPPKRSVLVHCRESTVGAGEAGASQAERQGDGEAGIGAAAQFERVVTERESVKKFAARPLPDGVLQWCLGLAARAPTGFNVQPYVAIVVTDEETKRRVAGAMLGPNAQRVMEAAATVVFAADNCSARLVPAAQRLAAQQGAPDRYWRLLLPIYANLFAGGFGFLACVPALRSLFNFLGYLVRKVSLTIASYIMPVPTVSTTETWSMKHTMFPACTFMQACGAAGLATCAMEGFDARRLRSALNIPNRYSPAVAFAVGYAAEEPEGKQRPKSPRFPPEELFHDNAFGAPLQGVPVF